MSPWIYFLVTLAIAWHGLTYKDPDGDHPTVHLLFGCIALIFAMRFLFVDILGLPILGVAPLDAA
ncbi:MAG: hypothetical protein LLP51_07655 [Halorhodospira halophila]|uniref:hypothetical protein n=1 Tax=Halorhodospira TaxID=85108 RepID=UPI00191158C2|nr:MULTISPECIES: hypothetical protein [Halorhodospira]MBK5937304.1 hypothetical protein [Halorhodospira halophila]MBK5944209.1 hypothetical protein [Halorhodospira halophila]MCC3751255.1 hypothetical protein [Halorhodospira halophila]MCG5527672.1 hypothetical protein [Halorhodospira halophila]MCG5532689.1 hypothetical protein [Halorhodospira sp. 9621]